MLYDRRRIQRTSNLIGGGRIIDWLLPIGSVRAFATGVDPNKIYKSQTWERFSKGQTLVGVDEADADFETVGKTGGEKAHTLTLNEAPAHAHESGSSAYTRFAAANASIQGLTGANPSGSGYDFPSIPSDATWTQIYSTNSKGGSEAHNNLQPYTTVYYWKRIA